MSDQPIDIYCFSGTGNTLRVTQAMRDVFVERQRSAKVHLMEKSEPSAVPLDHVIGLAFPVAAFSTYPLVWRFVQALPRAAGTAVFMADTMGGRSGGMVGPLRRMLTRKGYRPLGAREIIMPTNVFYRADAAAEDATSRRGLAAARAYAEDLLAGKTKWGRVPIVSDLVYALSRAVTGMWKLGWGKSRFGMRVNRETCTRCGLCHRVCPTRAIEMQNGPVFTTRCEFCMRCAGMCPVSAIHFGRSTYKPYAAVSAKEFLAGE